MFSPKRNAKRSAEEEAVAAPSDDTKQTAAQSLAKLGGEDVGAVADLMDAEVAGGAAAYAATSTPMKKAKMSNAMGEEAEEATGGAAVAEAVAGEGEQDAAAIAVQEEVSTAFPESTTPRRVAGANVLASLGGSGTNAADGQAKMEGVPALPPIVEVATAEGMAAQHDYLLQNLVHVSTLYRDEKRNNPCH